MIIRLGIWRLRIGLTIRQGKVSFFIVKRPLDTGGISSRTMDFKHVLFLDYDNVRYDFMVDELKWLHNEFKLSPWYVFSSSDDRSDDGIKHGNYHAICLTKMDMDRVKVIQGSASIDRSYGTMPSRSIYKDWAIRTMPKVNNGKEIKNGPKFITCVGDRGLGNFVSSGHLLYLMKHYDIPLINYQRPDQYREIYEVEYETAKG